MTKADIVSNISEAKGVEKAEVQAVVEAFMEEVKNSLENGKNVYLRGFGSFIIKRRAEKTGSQYLQEHHDQDPGTQYPGFQAFQDVRGVGQEVGQDQITLDNRYLLPGRRL